MSGKTSVIITLNCEPSDEGAGSISVQSNASADEMRQLLQAALAGLAIKHVAQ